MEIIHVPRLTVDCKMSVWWLSVLRWEVVELNRINLKKEEEEHDKELKPDGFRGSIFEAEFDVN